MSTEDYSTLTHVSPVLTNEVLTDALTKWFSEDVSFTHWEYVGDTSKGDSYMSEVMRIRVHGKDKSGTPKHAQVILKCIPKNTTRRLTFRSDQFFRNEIKFYEIVLPGLLKFQASKNITDPFTNYAKLFYSYCDGLNDVVCLEDATLENFGPGIRQEGIDYDHCKLTFEILAKFHAISFAMRDQEPKKFNEIRSAIFEAYYDEKYWDWYERFWKRLSGIAIDAVEKEYPNSIYVEKIKEFAAPETYKKLIKAVKDTYETGVISQGDCWTSNFLYKYEESKPVDAKMIDFQLARCGSPILDLAFAVYACTTQDLRLKYYDELMNYYYKVLARQIREMGSDPAQIYSLDTFMSEIKKYSFFGLAFSFESTPFIVLAPEDAVNMDIPDDGKKMNMDDFWPIKPFKTKEGRLREANNIVHCVDNGYI